MPVSELTEPSNAYYFIVLNNIDNLCPSRVGYGNKHTGTVVQNYLIITNIITV